MIAPPTILDRRRAAFAAATACVLVLAALPAGAVEIDPTPAEAPLMLEPGDLLDRPAAGESLLVDEPLPPPRGVEESVVSAPEVLDVSAAAARGMLIDELDLEEMPFEASSGSWFWNGGWYAGAESMWMQRSRENRQRLAVDEPVVGALRKPIPYSTTGQPFNLAPGARITIGKALDPDFANRGRALEFVYYGGMNWYDFAGYNAMQDGVIITPINRLAPGFNYAGRFENTIRSDFNSWEFNYRLRRRLGRDQLVMSPGGSWARHAERGFLPGLIIGARVARVTEGFTLRSSRPDINSTILPAVPPSDFSGYYRIGTENWLLGLNLGADLISQNEFFYWGLRGRAAPAISFANMSQAASGVNTTDIGPKGTTKLSDWGSQVGAGFIGDLTIMAGWQVTPNFSIQGGYDFLWVAGIATSERQLNLDNRDIRDIDAGGQTFCQGLSFGCMCSW